MSYSKCLDATRAHAETVAGGQGRMEGGPQTAGTQQAVSTAPQCKNLGGRREFRRLNEWFKERRCYMNS